MKIPDGPFIKAKRPLCVFVGRFDPRKRPEIFFRLVERIPDFNFIAVGKAHDKSYQKYLERRYFNLPNLEVTGFIDPFRNDKLHHILSKAWVLIHPAAREGLPTALQEASAHEVAVLAYVDPGKYVSRCGRVIPKEGGLKAIENVLRELVESGEWCEQSRAGRAYNIEHHSIQPTFRT